MRFYVSFTFRSRLPFHPAKLHAALNRATASLNRGEGFGSGASATKKEKKSKKSKRKEKEDMVKAFGSLRDRDVVRATNIIMRDPFGGVVDVAMGGLDNLTTAIEFVRAGKLRALGLTSKERNPLTPELVPICETMPELRPFDVSTWFGVFLPANTPRPVVDSLNAQIKLWLDDEKTKERFKTMAGFPAYGTPEQFNGFVNAQIALWKSVIDKEGLKLDVN